MARCHGEDGVAAASTGRQYRNGDDGHHAEDEDFRLTGTGKVMRRRANRGHLFEHKSSRLTRRLYGEVTLAPSDVKEIKKLLGK
jgi:large subunit ribosomal protein L35